MKMVNMISGLVSNTYEDKLAEIGLETLKERLHIAEMVTMNKMAHNVGDMDLQELFDQLPGRHVMRATADQLNLRPRPANLEIRCRF
jgi:hypothetical protein